MNTPSRIPLLVAQLPDADALLPYLRQIDANRWYTNFGPLVMQLEQRCSLIRKRLARQAVLRREI